MFPKASTAVEKEEEVTGGRMESQCRSLSSKAQLPGEANSQKLLGFVKVVLARRNRLFRSSF